MTQAQFIKKHHRESDNEVMSDNALFSAPSLRYMSEFFLNKYIPKGNTCHV